PPGAKPVTQVVGPTGTKLPGTVSLTVKLVLGARPVKLPVRVTVVPAAPPLRMIELPPGVSEKVKLPLPPSTCLVTTIWPLARSVKPLVAEPQEATQVTQLVGQTGTK